MNWNTIYITGRHDFREDVRRKLEHSKLNFMPGYLDNTGHRSTSDLYWLDENLSVSDFKHAIGSKLIWRYRLRFYKSLEEFLQAQEEKKSTTFLTKEDLQLINKIRNGFRTQKSFVV